MRWCWTAAAAVLLLLCAAPQPADSAAVLSDRLLRRLRAEADVLDPTGGAAQPYLRAYAAALWRHGVRRPGQVRALVERRADLLPSAVSEPAALAALLTAWDGDSHGDTHGDTGRDAGGDTDRDTGGLAPGDGDGRALTPDHLDDLVRELVQAAADRLTHQRTAPAPVPESSPTSSLAPGPEGRPEGRPEHGGESASPRGIISVLQGDTSTSYIIHPDGPGGSAGVMTERLRLGSAPQGDNARRPDVGTDLAGTESVTEAAQVSLSAVREVEHSDHSAAVVEDGGQDAVDDVADRVNQTGGVNSLASETSNSVSADSGAISHSVDDNRAEPGTNIPSTGSSEPSRTTVPMTILGITMPIGDSSDDFHAAAVTPAADPGHGSAATGPVAPPVGGDQGRGEMLDEPTISDDLYAFLERFEQRQQLGDQEEQEGGVESGSSSDAEVAVIKAPERHGSADLPGVGGLAGPAETLAEREGGLVIDSDGSGIESVRNDSSTTAAPPSKVYPADPWELYNSLFRPDVEVGEADGSTVRSATPLPPPATQPPTSPPRRPAQRPASTAGFGSLAELLMPLLDTFEKLKPRKPGPPTRPRPQGPLRWGQQRPTAGLPTDQRWPGPEAALGRFPLLPPPPPTRTADRPPPASDDRPTSSDGMPTDGGASADGGASEDGGTSTAVSSGVMSHRMGPLELGPTTPPNQPRPAVQLLESDLPTRQGPAAGRPWLGSAIGQQSGGQHSDRRPPQEHHPDQLPNQHQQQFNQQPRRPPNSHQNEQFDQRPDDASNQSPGQGFDQGGLPDSQFAHRFGQQPFYESHRNPLLAGIVEPHMKKEVHRFSTMDLHRLRGGGGVGPGGRVPVVSLQLPGMLAVLPHGSPPVHLPPPRWVTEKVPPIVTKRLTTSPPPPPPPSSGPSSETVTEAVPEPTTAASTEWEWITTPEPPAETPPSVTTVPPSVTTLTSKEDTGEALRPHSEDGASGVVSHLTTTESGLEALGAIISGILGTASPATDGVEGSVERVEGEVDGAVVETSAVGGAVVDAGYELFDVNGKLVGNVGNRAPNVVDKERPSLEHHDLAADRPHSGLAELDGLLTGTSPSRNRNRWNHGLDETDPGLRGRVVGGGGAGAAVNDFGTNALPPSDTDLTFEASGPEETSVPAVDGGAAASASARLSSSDIAYILIGTTAGVIVLCVTLVVVLVRGRRGGRLYALFARVLRSDYRQGLDSRAGTSSEDPSPPPPPPVPALPSRPPPAPPVGLTTHKLGSWFNGRSETLGSETFHSKLALPVPYASHAAPTAETRQPRPHGYNLRQLVGGLTTQLLSSSSNGSGSVVNTSDFDDTPKSRRAARDDESDADAARAVRGSYLFGGLMSPPGTRPDNRPTSGESSRAASRHRRHRSESTTRGTRSRGSRRSHSQPQTPELAGHGGSWAHGSERDGRRRHRSHGSRRARRSHSEQRTPDRDRRLTRPRIRSPHPRRRRGSPDYRRRRRSDRSQRHRERGGEEREGHWDRRQPRWPPRPDDGYSHGSGSPVEWSSNDERLI